MVYAAETYLTEPPTVESLRFTTRQLQRHRPTTSKPYDPRYAMRSRPHSFVPGKLVHPAPGLPQNVLPPNQGQREVKPQIAPAGSASVKQAPAPQQPARVVPPGACFNCGLPGHFARECPNRDLARKPTARAAPDERVNLCQNNVASASSGPVFCVNCGMTEHSASQCQNVPVHEDLAYSLWAELPPAPQTMSDSEMVLMLRPAEAAHVATPLTVTCGKIQIQTNPDPTTFDPPGRTIMSARLLLAIEKETRPGLTLDALIDEMTTNENCRQLTLPQPEERQVKGVFSTYYAYSPIPVKVCIDGVDMRFGATIITDGFPPGICLGPQELRCYNIDVQEPSGEARIDERASLVVSFVVSFVVPDAAPVPLRGLIDTGSGESILTFSGYNRIAVRTGTLLRPYGIDLYAANGKTIKTFGLAEKIKFQLGGYELETNFVVVDDPMGVEDFLLGRSFLRAYQVLVDLTAMKIIIPQTVPGQVTETQQSNANYVCKVYEQMNLDSSSEYSSSSEIEFLSSTDPSELGFSERDIKKRTDPALMASIPGPEAQLDKARGLWSPTVSDTLSKLLREFDDLFMKYKADIGKCKIAKHPVEVEPGAVPHREGARRMSPEKAERANQEFRDLLALGMIQPSLSPWASGIVMVKKKSGELRFCCDFRPLKEVTIKDAYPLPRIDESLSRLGKAKIYTRIDLAWAFWQIPVQKVDRQKTAFACELGLFEWRRMPFGMCNASATFQRAIARALQRIVNREGSMVMAYIDDIVIPTETIEDHMDRLREVFQCLREAGFKMRVSKCDLMKSEIKYLGRVVSADGIKPDPKAVTKLRDWDIPRTKTELISFLGFANYYRDFIPWHAKLVAPLHAMTGIGSPLL